MGCGCSQAGNQPGEGRIERPLGRIKYLVEGGSMPSPEEYDPQHHGKRAIDIARARAQETGARVRSVRA